MSDSNTSVIASVRLARLTVGGDRLGQNFGFSIRAGDVLSEFNKRLQPASSVKVKRVLYETTLDAGADSITLPIDASVIERDTTPDQGRAALSVTLDPRAIGQKTSALAVQVMGRGVRDEGKIAVVTLEIITEIRTARFRVTPQPLPVGRLNLLRVSGPRPPVGRDAYSVQTRDGATTAIKVVSAAPVPTRFQIGDLRVLLDDGVPVGFEPSDVAPSGPATIDDEVELLVWVPPGTASETLRLRIACDGAPELVPLAIDAASRRGSRPLFDPACAPDRLRHAVPELPDLWPDISFAAAAAVGRSGIDAAAAGFRDRFLSEVQAKLAERRVNLETARASLREGSSLLGPLGVTRVKPSPGRPAEPLSIRPGAPLIASTPAEADDDADTFPDSLEADLARAFQPAYHISKRERSDTGFPHFAPDAATRQQIDAAIANPPLIHHRVHPLGVSENAAGRYAVARIDYFSLWNRDNGLPPRGILVADATTAIAFLSTLSDPIKALLATVLGVIGIEIVNDALIAHEGDEERSAVLVAAQLQPGETGWPTDLARWKAYDYYTASHEGTPFLDQSTYTAPDAPVDLRDPADPTRLIERNYELWLSLSKHGTYPFDPDGLPLFDAQFVLVVEIFAIVIDILVRFIFNSNIQDFVPEILTDISIISTILISVFRIVIAEQFVPLPAGQSPAVARELINVGEPERPRFPWINETGKRDLRSKFDPLWQING